MLLRCVVVVLRIFKVQWNGCRFRWCILGPNAFRGQPEQDSRLIRLGISSVDLAGVSAKDPRTPRSLGDDSIDPLYNRFSLQSLPLRQSNNQSAISKSDSCIRSFSDTSYTVVLSRCNQAAFGSRKSSLSVSAKTG